MLLLVIVLIVTNLVTIAVLAWYLLRPIEHPAPDASLARWLLHHHRRPAVSTSSTRRVITIEILNAIELAGTRGRLAGIAGSIAPGITRRVVYDQAIKLVRHHLAHQKVVADVRLHIVREDRIVPGRWDIAGSAAESEAAPGPGSPAGADGSPAGADGSPAGPPAVDLVKHPDDQSG